MLPADAVAVALLAALTLAFFWKIALTNQVLAGLDVFAYFYPYHDSASAALRAGHVPLWNPYLFMGAPLLANSQAAVLYPLNWPLLWLSTPKQIAWSIVVHIWLAAAGTYLFARLAMRLGPLASFVSAMVFALGGFLGAQVEHVNQLNASAWLPWLLLCLEGAMGQGQRRWLAVAGGSAVVGLILLAGHTQAAYIVLSGVVVCAVLRGWLEPDIPKWKALLTRLGTLALMTGFGIVLAAGQLLPTLELSRLSVRKGGLPYNEAASFSLKPSLIFKAFLPPLFWDPPFSEYVAFIGLLALTLAGIGIWAVLRQRHAQTERQGMVAYGRTLLLLALLGVFFAFGAYNPIYYLLYRLVPGFDLFRVPARWLLLYSFGMASLAGIGLETLPKLSSAKRYSRIAPVGIACLVVVELFLAGLRLAYNRPTTPIAFDSMRTAPAHLLADPTPQPFRFLSMSDIGYDPGDLTDLQLMYSEALSPEAIYDLIVATKMKEVLAYNLPLRYRLASVDGYDGGLLPIQRYVTLERLFVAEEEIWPDGRLRQQLRQIPPVHLLSLLNVRYVITDKTQDVWIDDVFYDLEHTLPLGQVTLTELPAFETTHLGIVSYLAEAADVVDGTPVARITVTDTAGNVVTRTLQAGIDTAEGLYTPERVKHDQASVSHHWRDNDQGNDYLAVLNLARPLQPDAISVHALLPDQQVHLRGLTLIDGQTGTSRTVSVNPAYRLVHTGDVKIYQNLTALPRAFVVHQARVVPDDEAALSALRDPTFDPTQMVVLADGEALAGRKGESNVGTLSYEPEKVRLQVSLDTPGYLVLSDTYYPGWTADIDGKPAPIRRANVYFRALMLSPGEHQVTFRFQPISAHVGLGTSVVSWLTLALLAAIMVIRSGRKAANAV